MSTIKTVTRPAFREIIARVEALLGPLGKELGIKFETGAASFNPTDFRFRVAGKLLADNQSSEDMERKEFALYAPRFGMLPEDYGAKFTSRGEQFQVKQLMPTRPVNPVLAIRVKDGRKFIFPVDVVKRAIDG